jgi:hypothetical protein
VRDLDLDRADERFRKWMQGNLAHAADYFGLTTDAATLYCYSLLVPEVARQVYEVFSDVLDTPAGRLAQIHVAARLLTRAEQDFPDLIDPLRRHVQPLLD